MERLCRDGDGVLHRVVHQFPEHDYREAIVWDVESICYGCKHLNSNFCTAHQELVPDPLIPTEVCPDRLDVDGQ